MVVSDDEEEEEDKPKEKATKSKKKVSDTILYGWSYHWLQIYYRGWDLFLYVFSIIST